MIQHAKSSISAVASIIVTLLFICECWTGEFINVSFDRGDANAVFRRMEHALKCKTLQVQLEVTANTRNVNVMWLKGHLAVAEGDKVHLELDGEVQGKPKKIVLVSNG